MGACQCCQGEQKENDVNLNKTIEGKKRLGYSGIPKVHLHPKTDLTSLAQVGETMSNDKFNLANGLTKDFSDVENEQESQVIEEDCELIIENPTKRHIERAQEDYWVQAEDINKELHFYMKLQDISPESRKKKDIELQMQQISENLEAENDVNTPSVAAQQNRHYIKTSFDSNYNFKKKDENLMSSLKQSIDSKIESNQQSINYDQESQFSYVTDVMVLPSGEQSSYISEKSERSEQQIRNEKTPYYKIKLAAKQSFKNSEEDEQTGNKKIVLDQYQESQERMQGNTSKEQNSELDNSHSFLTIKKVDENASANRLLKNAIDEKEEDYQLFYSSGDEEKEGGQRRQKSSQKKEEFQNLELKMDKQVSRTAMELAHENSAVIEIASDKSAQKLKMMTRKQNQQNQQNQDDSNKLIKSTTSSKKNTQSKQVPGKHKKQ